MIEYLEDVIEAHPEEAFVTRDGEAIRFKSGDRWFDSLDDRVAAGEDLKLEDFGLSKAESDKLRRGKPVSHGQLTVESLVKPKEEIEEVSDSYAQDDR